MSIKYNLNEESSISKIQYKGKDVNGNDVNDEVLRIKYIDENELETSAWAKKYKLTIPEAVGKYLYSVKVAEPTDSIFEKNRSLNHNSTICHDEVITYNMAVGSNSDFKVKVEGDVTLTNPVLLTATYQTGTVYMNRPTINIVGFVGDITVHWGDGTITKKTLSEDRLKYVNTIEKNKDYPDTGTYNIYVEGTNLFFETTGARIYFDYTYRTHLTSMNIPNTYLTIITDGFLSHSQITQFTIPETVTKINAGSFNHCYKLTSINIPENVTQIATAAFGYCTSLKNYFGHTAWYVEHQGGTTYYYYPDQLLSALKTYKEGYTFKKYNLKHPTLVLSNTGSTGDYTTSLYNPNPFKISLKVEYNRYGDEAGVYTKYINIEGDTYYEVDSGTVTTDKPTFNQIVTTYFTDSNYNILDVYDPKVQYDQAHKYNSSSSGGSIGGSAGGERPVIRPEYDVMP